MATIVLTVICDDHPGVVDSLARCIAAHDGNWEESRMAHLAGKFAGLLRVTVPDGKGVALRQALLELRTSSAMQVTVELSEYESAADARRSMRLELTGHDHPGIVHDVTQVLARYGANIEELETQTRPASMAGGSLFHAKAAFSIAEGVSIDGLTESLEALANELMVDIELVSGQ